VGDIAKEASAIAGVTKVLSADSKALEYLVAENLCAVLKPVAAGYSHVLCAANNTGKNYLPRLGAMMDSAPLNDIISVVDENTFTRPMYAGNAVATVTMSDKIKVSIFFVYCVVFIFLLLLAK
jgi:electron transfer flavoprotein alpha subunit